MSALPDSNYKYMEFQTLPGDLDALTKMGLTTKKGEFTSLIRHARNTKLDLLGVVADLYQAKTGKVQLKEQKVITDDKDSNIIFQNNSLLPWLTAYQNVELVVEQVYKDKMDKEEKKAWIEYNLQLVYMDHDMDKRPIEISGSMTQRIGLACALAMQPELLVVDEPYGESDSVTRKHIQDLLVEIQKKLNNTIVLFTHDINEAVLLSDNIVMLTDGPTIQIGDVLNVNLRRPRKRNNLPKNNNYNRLRGEILSFLYGTNLSNNKEVTA